MLQITNSNKVQKLFINECHTIFSELNFREKYGDIYKLSCLQVPIMAMSGSIPKAFIDDYMKYIFKSEGNHDNKILINNQLFGSKLLTLNIVRSKDYIKDTCSEVNKYIQQHKGFNVHIIVSTIKEGKTKDKHI